jgi:NTP pyrophosphatase (non-canonical NTP hydrolase)
MENKKTDELAQLSSLIQAFCQEREWDQFHTPKDVAIGMVTESAELLELFRFKSDEECREVLATPSSREKVSDELADVFYWVLRFAQMNDFNLNEALHSKMKKNELKYPVESARGNNRKYTDY